MMSDKWKYTGETVCRGSFALGTACGYCRKCKEQIAEHTATKAVEYVRADYIEELEERLEKEMQDLDAADRRAKRLQARIEELEAACWRMQAERDRAIEWRDSDKSRADTAEVKLETAIIEGVRIATTVPVEQVPDAIKTTLAELTGGKDE